MTADREIALARDDTDGDAVASGADEVDGLCRCDRRGTYDASGIRAASVRDRAFHRRGRRDAVVDDDDAAPIEGFGSAASAQSELEILCAHDAFGEERRGRSVIVVAGVRRHDVLAGRRYGAERELGLTRVTDLSHDEHVEVGSEHLRHRLRDDDASAGDAQHERVALRPEERCERSTGFGAVCEQEATLPLRDEEIYAGSDSEENGRTPNCRPYF